MSIGTTVKAAGFDARRQKGQLTRERILGAATRLFAEQGYNGVSLRQICLAAEVNLALMSYHFGTKEHLLNEIFKRGTSLINDERTQLLEDLQLRTGARGPSVEELLHAFISPTLRATSPKAQHELHFLRLSGRLATDPTPEVRRVMVDVYDSVALVFVRMLRKACPSLSHDEFFLRLVFFYGAMLYTRADTGRVVSLARKMDVKLATFDGERACRHLVPFLAAGFRAPEIGNETDLKRRVRGAPRP